MMSIAILDPRPAATPGTLRPHDAAVDVVRLFALDRPPQRRPVACHWYRDASGQLACIWEPDIGPVPQV